MHENLSHRDPTMDTDYRPTRYGSTDSDRLREDAPVQHETKPSHAKHNHKSPYRNLIWMGVLHVPIMYFIMFSMVDTAGDVFQNLNTFYMALMMAAPMVALMPLMMNEMYPDKKKNRLVIMGAMLILVGAFSAIRFQSAIGDTQFVRSMIPHHSGAILMCEKAKISDPELKSLCGEISKGQRQEIRQMENILNRL
jgi:cation transport ATPase